MRSYEKSPGGSNRMGAPVRVGEVVAGKFEVTRELGSGGMGVVVEARHRVLDRLVALKFMHAELSTNVQATERFLAEAKAAARLKNEHVGRILDADCLPNGVPYIVMEYLEGRDLGRILAEHRGPLIVADAVEYVLQACEAMIEAHVHGIVHRDLKPQNLFVTMRQDGGALVKVLDFGISKVQFVQGLTAAHQLIGSPPYMSPEQIRSPSSVDARADLWSLGVILYQLLSKQLPFTAEAPHAVMLQILSETAVPLAALRPDLPPELTDTVGRCLQKDPRDRFASAAELMQPLFPFARDRTRAAMSLIDQVKTSTLPESRLRPPSLDTDMAVIPNPFGGTDVATAPATDQTTCGSAASSRAMPNVIERKHHVGIAVVAGLLGLAALIVIVRWRLSNDVPGPAVVRDLSAAEPTPTSDALDAPVSHDIAVTPVALQHPSEMSDANAPQPSDTLPAQRATKSTTIADQHGAPSDAAAPEDAPAGNELLEGRVATKPMGVPARSKSYSRPHPKSGIDAGPQTTPPDAPFLEPARTDDVPPLTPR